jgi:serine/threonine protein kinase
MRYGGCTDSTTLANVAHDLFNALAFLHSNNIIHRDVKPANVLISRSGVAKLSDFGIVSDMDLKPSVLASTFVGTMSYMSPERLRGEPYSFAADVWGAGLTVAAFSLGRFPAPASACANIFAMLDFFDKHDALLDVADANLAMFLRPTLSLNPAKRPTANECLAAPICARVGRRVRFEAAPKSAESRLLHYHSAGELSGSSTMESDLPMPPPLPLSSEDRAVRLQIIAERVVEKLLTDWCERGAAGQGQKQHAEISLSFKAMERLAEHLGVPVEHVVAVFKMQVEELDRAVKLKFSIKEDLRE